MKPYQHTKNKRGKREKRQKKTKKVKCWEIQRNAFTKKVQY